MTPEADQRQQMEARRKAARRTALWVGVIAVAVYVAFLMTGVLGQ